MNKTYLQMLIVLSFFCFQKQVTGQTLDSLFRLAVENNSELRAVQSEYQAILARQDQVSQLPNPQLGVAIPVLRPETRLGPQVMMVSASQMFPWFGTFDSKKDLVIQMSKAKFEELAAIKLDLFFQIKIAYYQLVFLKNKERLYRESLENYKAIESIAVAKVEAGQSSVADVLRVQAKIDEMESVLNQIPNDALDLLAQINYVTNVPFNQQVNLIDSIATNLIDYNLDSYKSKIEKHHPIIKKLEYQIAVSNSRLKLNEKLNKPTFGVGLDYSLVNPRVDATPLNNGQDIFIPKVMVSIPLYRKSYKARINEESLNQDALRHKKESATDLVLSRLVAYKSDYDNAQISSELASSQLDKISSAYEILLANYSTGGKKFEELLTTQNEIIQLRLKSYWSSLNMGIAKAQIQRLTEF